MLDNTNRSISLAEFFGVPKVQFALVIIDVQREFCDPTFQKHGTAHTKSVAENIARLTPEFRKLRDLSVYVVHYDTKNEGFANAKGGAFLVQSQPQEQITKTDMSAITSSPLTERLKQKGITHLLLMGFNSSSCIYFTATEAMRAQFNVALLSDGIGESGHNLDHDECVNANLQMLHLYGALITDAETALSHLSL